MSRWNPVVGCKVPDCSRPHSARGYCATHARRARVGLDLDTPIRPIWRGRIAFDEAYEVVASGCWEWRAAISPEGYGRLGKEYAHRISFERSKGPIPDGLHIDHLCRNRVCVNPEHLEPVTPQENTRRGMSPAVVLHRENRCARGHLMTPENTYSPSRSDPTRRGDCRTCVRALAAGACPHCGRHYKWLKPHLRTAHASVGAES